MNKFLSFMGLWHSAMRAYTESGDIVHFEIGECYGKNKARDLIVKFGNSTD